MRRAAFTAATVLGAFCADGGLQPLFAGGAAEEDRSGEYDRILVDRETALAEMFPGVSSWEIVVVEPTAAERERLEEKLGRKLLEQRIELLRGLDADKQVVGYAVVTEEVGKFQPITFVVAITPEAALHDIAVLIYRESHGEDVKRRRFLRQFAGKSVEDAIRVNKDVINISGATLSAHAIARGAKKVLWLAQVILFDAQRAARLEWKPLPEVAKPGGRDAPAGKEQGWRRARFRMGTLLEVVLYGDPRAVRAAGCSLFDEVARLEALLSIYREGSDLARLNRSPPGVPTRVARETLSCVAGALHFASSTGGSFDPTLRPGGRAALLIDARAGTIAWTKPGFAIDPGAIGKGYALDRCARLLRALGVRSGLIDFGGQVLVLEPPPGAPCWVIGVRDPSNPATVAGYFRGANTSVATTGFYERGAHLVDPRTGSVMPPMPASATVIHRSATAADALSTALLVGGRATVATLARAGCCGALYIDETGQRYARAARDLPDYRRLPRLPATAIG